MDHAVPTQQRASSRDTPLRLGAGATMRAPPASAQLEQHGIHLGLHTFSAVRVAEYSPFLSEAAPGSARSRRAGGRSGTAAVPQEADGIAAVPKLSGSFEERSLAGETKSLSQSWHKTRQRRPREGVRGQRHTRVNATSFSLFIASWTAGRAARRFRWPGCQDRLTDRHSLTALDSTPRRATHLRSRSRRPANPRPERDAARHGLTRLSRRRASPRPQERSRRRKTPLECDGRVITAPTTGEQNALTL
jgi:hypothetical protein